jgi:hypothetical protein
MSANRRASHPLWLDPCSGRSSDRPLGLSQAAKKALGTGGRSFSSDIKSSALNGLFFGSLLRRRPSHRCHPDRSSGVFRRCAAEGSWQYLAEPQLSATEDRTQRTYPPAINFSTRSTSAATSTLTASWATSATRIFQPFSIQRSCSNCSIFSNSPCGSVGYSSNASR